MGCHSVGAWNAIPSNKIARALRGIDWFARLSGTVRTSDIRACPVCGTLLPDGNESCPVCALRGALESEGGPFSEALLQARARDLTIALESSKADDSKPRLKFLTLPPNSRYAQSGVSVTSPDFKPSVTARLKSALAPLRSPFFRFALPLSL
jgi:hypothetical protein